MTSLSTISSIAKAITLTITKDEPHPPVMLGISPITNT